MVEAGKACKMQNPLCTFCFKTLRACNVNIVKKDRKTRLAGFSKLVLILTMRSRLIYSRLSFIFGTFSIFWYLPKLCDTWRKQMTKFYWILTNSLPFDSKLIFGGLAFKWVRFTDFLVSATLLSKIWITDHIKLTTVHIIGKSCFIPSSKRVPVTKRWSFNLSMLSNPSSYSHCVSVHHIHSVSSSARLKQC